MKTLEASKEKTAEFSWAVRIIGKHIRFFRSMESAQEYAESFFGYYASRVYRPDGTLLCEFEV